MAESGEVPMRNRSSSSREVIQEVESTMEVLTRVHWDLTFFREVGKDDKARELPANEQTSNENANTERQTAEKQRNVLRMLEKSLMCTARATQQLSWLREY
ncbi:hypothetical protein OIU76_013717 [Salix suchowensis]|nr:hypothetical protein OIU76_013717 [Salix suchowensis]